MNTQDTLGLEEAAELLKVNPETVRQLATAGALLGAKIGVSWVFIKADLIEYLRSEARRQTSERRELAAMDRMPGERVVRVSTAVKAAGARAGRRARPNLDEVEKQAAA